jgi:hypothetical protein
MSGSGKPDPKVRTQRRLAAALRENLKRRKAQEKGRASGEAAERPGNRAARPHDSAGIGADKREA